MWNDPRADGAQRRSDMPMHRFGPTRRNVPAIGQGTWFIEKADRGEAIAALRLGLDRGMTHIDTAEKYGWGAAEEIVGEAIAGRRDEVFLVSKIVPDYASVAGTIASCEASLARLGTDRLDCYLLHWRGSLPLADTFDAFEQLCRAGKILSWGVSNFYVDDLEAALAVAGEGRIACNQVPYDLTERAMERRVLPWCETHGIAMVGYSPFGQGRFPGPHTPSGRVLVEIAAAYDATPRQVALSFLTRRPSLFTIPKAANRQHAAENAGAVNVRLSETDIARIEAAFPLARLP
jgi:diketogulonate reductase-like aldo/keto reductase